MKMLKIIITGALLFTFVSCATAPIPTMTGSDNGGVGIAVETMAPIGIFNSEPDIIYFARINEDTETYPNKVFPSNYSKSGLIYLLNIPPGKYVAVASFKQSLPSTAPESSGVSISFTMGRTGYTTYFANDIIKQTETIVRSRQVSFMGEFEIKQKVGLEEADNAQIHYSNIIAPGSVKGGFMHFISGDYHYTGSLNKYKLDDATRENFLLKAKGDLSKSEWSGLIEAQLNNN